MKTYEEKDELGVNLNKKLKKFTKELTYEEKKGLNTILALAEYAILKMNTAMFGLENEQDITKLRRKLVESHCDKDRLLLPEISSPEGTRFTLPTLVTLGTRTVTVGSNWWNF